MAAIQKVTLFFIFSIFQQTKFPGFLFSGLLAMKQCLFSLPVPPSLNVCGIDNAEKRHGSALTSALCFFIATFLKTGWVAWDFAPNGILEYWNNGSQDMEISDIRQISSTRKNFKQIISLTHCSIVSLFHYSMIEVIFMSQKIACIFIRCRNCETKKAPLPFTIDDAA